MPPNGDDQPYWGDGRQVDPGNVTGHKYAGQARQDAINQAQRAAGVKPGQTGLVPGVVRAVATTEGTLNAQQQLNQQTTDLASQVGTRDAPSVGDSNYLSISHQDLYDMVNTNLSSGQVGD
ncbi:MAG TPA: hypothetical protein VHV49_17770, partial [Pseudonocardiaceae bacterium]|nr:hypothetical protein [Pseudonocardiaceae bacterium]